MRPVAIPTELQRVYDAFLRERFPKADRKRVAADVARMSEAFTAERSELPGSYLNHPPSRSAYLAFFHPLQVLRALAVLEETQARAEVRGLWPPGRRGAGDDAPLRVLDLGAGLGAMTHAFLAVGAAAGGLPTRLEVTLVDHQKSALADARDLLVRAAAVLRPGAQAPAVRTADARVETWLPRAHAAGWTYDVVLVGAVLNEVRSPSKVVAQAVSRLDDAAHGGGLLVVVEPAVPEGARDLMAAREELLDATTTLAPCTHGTTCPLLALRKDWCFTVRSATFPAFVAEMSRRLGHQTAEVRYALWSAAGRPVAAPPEHDEASHGRVVSDPVPGGQVICVEGRRERMPERGAALRRGALVRKR